MAVLNKIRQRSVFLIIIIALALFSFVLADLFKSGGLSGQKNQNTIATINGEDVTREDFARKVEGFQRNRRNVSSTQAVNQVWDMTLQEELLKEQIEKTGILVGDDQFNMMLKQVYAGNPNFTNQAGMFDRAVLEEYVANLKATSPQAYAQWESMEEQIVLQAKNQIYYNMIRAGVGATLVEGEQAYLLQNESVDLKYVMLPYANAENVEVSKEEIKDYIKKHKARFEKEANTNIKYVYFEEKASAKDEKEAREELEAEVSNFNAAEDVERFIASNSDMPYDATFKFKSALPSENANQIFNLEEGQTYGPYKENGFWKYAKITGVKQIADSVKLRRILVSYQGSAIDQGDFTQTKEQAKNLADSIAEVVKADIAKFDELAPTYSDDPRSKDNGGDLGWNRYSNARLTPEVKDFAYNNTKGSVEVVENQLGFHVVMVEQANNKQKAIQVATIAKSIEPSEDTSSELYTETTKFEMQAADGDFDKLAEESSYQVKKVTNIKAMQENLNAALGNQRSIVKWTFNEETKVGDVKRFDLPSGYVVAKLTGKNKKGLQSPEEASPEVTPILRKEKQAKLIEDKISGKSMDEIAASENTKVQTANAITLSNPTLPGATSEPEVVGAAFSLKSGETTEPLAGKKGVYVVELVKKNEVTPLNSYKTFANRESNTRAANALSRVNEALESSAEIEDHRADFY
ncbi:peptidylprolyl isomerase [Mesonia aestuariivivens]|uniref:SurA N-terminal domain-containing protein n=1 Tax=Mesonia aestuariivivens TaxID=2796128 RepID=A0ABS6VZW1_9FLAO|nr:peptidylprolyl isomerase [Mesonia aestuariivivens]MBW2960433.1 SurA N-terminal domain-containing protein [Mesonia aestuariivivens]